MKSNKRAIYILMTVAHNIRAYFATGLCPRINYYIIETLALF